jgi:rod shape-determining protein MreD
MGPQILPVSACTGRFCPAYQASAEHGSFHVKLAPRVPLEAGLIAVVFHVKHASRGPWPHQPCSGSAAILGLPARQPPHRASGEQITYTSVLVAILVGIVHAGLAPVLVIGGVKPNLVLVAVVLVTSSFGFQAGIVWAFVAGVTANLLITEPLGSIPLALLAVAALVAGGGRLFGRLTWVYPVAAALVGSILADAVSLGALNLVGGSFQLRNPMDLVLPAAVLNAAITGVLLVPLRLALRRYGPEEKPAW